MSELRMTPEQIAAGQKMWRTSSRLGQVTQRSFDAEAMAPKTYILWVNDKGEKKCIIECELYVAGSTSGRPEGIGMLHGECPKCRKTFIVQEDNKSMTLERVPLRSLNPELQDNYRYDARKKGRPLSPDDEVVVVSSPTRWQCGYCKGWCVRVTGGVAITDMKGATQIIMHMRPTLIDPESTALDKPVEKKIEF